MKNALHFTLILKIICFVLSSAQDSIHPPNICDTLTTVEGKIYLVSHVEEHWKEIRFRPCDDGAKMYAMSRDRVASIKKAKRPVVSIPIPLASKVIAAPTPNPKLPPIPPTPPVDSLTRMATKTLSLGTLALLLSLSVVLSPVGLIVGLFSIGRAVEGLNMLKKHPGRRKLRRKLWLAIIFGGLAVLPFIGLILLLKGLQKFPNFSTLDNFHIDWSWGCC